jgi:hypothetical protein
LNALLAAGFALGGDARRDQCSVNDTVTALFGMGILAASA